MEAHLQTNLHKGRNLKISFKEEKRTKKKISLFVLVFCMYGRFEFFFKRNAPLQLCSSEKREFFLLFMREACTANTDTPNPHNKNTKL